jgi:bifunctional N-acetylglucosamine-1-phosphate-uridyltransferase/glucosamine-1-phosphate-acetyltransferase GlmU-like protein
MKKTPEQLLNSLISQHDQKQAWLTEIIEDAAKDKKAAIAFASLAGVINMIGCNDKEVIDMFLDNDREKITSMLVIMARAAECAFTAKIIELRDLFDPLKTE